ncbi:hypothetical protein [Sphingobium ummariense]
MTNFILHIGDGKCGSSAIQASLFDAREALGRIGFAYSSHHREGGNLCFVTLAGGRTRGDDTEQRAFALHAIEILKGDLDRCDTVILSSEAFLSFAPEDILPLLRMIAPQVGRIDAVAYVRDPAARYLSMAQQAIKASHKFPAPDRYARPWDMLLQRWEQGDMIDSLTVRSFDRDHLTGGDVVTDFAAVLRRLTGIADIPLRPMRANQSMSAEQMVVVQQFRRAFFGHIDGKAAPESERLVDFFTAMNAAGPVGTRPVLADAARTVVAERNAPVVDWLNARYGFGMRLDPPAPGAAAPQGKWTEIASILASVDGDYVRLFRHLVPRFAPGEGMAALEELAEREPGKSEAIRAATLAYWAAEEAASSP